MNKNTFFDKGYYKPDINGKLEEYLKKHDGCTASPLFKGYKHYKILWNKGLFIPKISVIRLMWNVGRGDEHFLVLNENQLEGITNVGYHSAREGIYDPKKLLKSLSWEPQHLNRNLLYQK